jgi:flagellar L-ring protein precursor FlgH
MKPVYAYRFFLSLLLAALACVQMTGATSLYKEQTYRPLTADNKAYRVGDTLTVQVAENSSATTSAATGTRRKNGITADVKNDGKQVGQLGVAMGGDFDGGGSTQRANRVLTTVTVTVREVLANGDLKISGEQLLVVNEEPQKVTLEGRVRPADVSDGNLVLSSRLADAKITYVGEGDIAERNQRPWWRKFLDWSGF